MRALVITRKWACQGEREKIFLFKKRQMSYINMGIRFRASRFELQEKAMRHEILSDESLDVMREVWARPEASVNTVWAALNSTRRKKVRRSTIQVQMTRLERYGWLGRRKSGREFLYTARYGKEETVGDLLSSLARRLYGGSYIELIRLLLTGIDFSPAERRKIKALWRKKNLPDESLPSVSLE